MEHSKLKQAQISGWCCAEVRKQIPTCFPSQVTSAFRHKRAEVYSLGMKTFGKTVNITIHSECLSEYHNFLMTGERALLAFDLSRALFKIEPRAGCGLARFLQQILLETFQQSRLSFHGLLLLNKQLSTTVHFAAYRPACTERPVDPVCVL
jgi:hypothetical protein